MTDVFISYASEDKERVAPLVKILETHGISVWWDRSIRPGLSFGDVIETALDNCHCVIVVWTNGAVTSRWVKAEAAEGARRGILVPVQLDETQIPLEFRGIQTAQLFGWKGNVENQEISNVVSAVLDVLAAQDTSTNSSNSSDNVGNVRDRIAKTEASHRRLRSIFQSKSAHRFLTIVPHLIGFLFLATFVWFIGPYIELAGKSLLSPVSSRLFAIGFLGVVIAIIIYRRWKSH